LDIVESVPDNLSKILPAYSKYSLSCRLEPMFSGPSISRFLHAFVPSAIQRMIRDALVSAGEPRRERESVGWQIEVFFDGDCPICRREIELLLRHDRSGNIRFTDVAAACFPAKDLGVVWSELMSEIHGRLPNGTWLRGVEVFSGLYAAVCRTSLVWLSPLPVVSGLLDRAHRVFARNRLKWTRRCLPGETGWRRPSIKQV
jgi:predicted DCC family thiol-disulfide oxidoreductase YuxK